MDIFALAATHHSWGMARQTAVASNIANANSPGYRAMDVAPFSLDAANERMSMTQTHIRHLNPSGTTKAEASAQPETPWEISHSGNSVSLEQELIKSGEVHKAMSINHAIVKSFHRLMLTGLRIG